MNGPNARYWERRAALLQQSAQLRTRLEGHVQALEPAWQVLDGAQRGLGWLRRHPWVPLLGLLALARRPRTALSWGWRAWRTWRWVQPWLGSERPTTLRQTQP
jgi:hypothetical protein